MKFAKVLASTATDMPGDFNGMFLRYKQLKKMLKTLPKVKGLDGVGSEGCTTGPGTSSNPATEQLPSSSGANDEAHQPNSSGSNGAGAACGSAGSPLSPEELQFIAALNEDLERFNAYFMDKEEDAVIRLRALSDELDAVKSPAEAAAVKGHIVDYHGEVVLLLHWSLLNYAACAKILKKHDKTTGVLLRAPYLANVLHQPFCATSLMSRLVKQAEQLVVKAGGTTGPLPESAVEVAAAVVGASPSPRRGEADPAEGAAAAAAQQPWRQQEAAQGSASGAGEAAAAAAGMVASGTGGLVAECGSRGSLASGEGCPGLPAHLECAHDSGSAEPASVAHHVSRSGLCAAAGATGAAVAAAASRQAHAATMPGAVAGEASGDLPHAAANGSRGAQQSVLGMRRRRASPRAAGVESVDVSDEEAAARSGDEQCSSQTSSHGRDVEECPLAKRTKAALETWAAMARTAVTPSTVLRANQQPHMHA